MTDTIRPLLDPASTVDLGDGWRAGVAVDADGRASLWLVSDTDGDEHAGCSCSSCAPHEGLGPLPAPYRYTVLGRCAAITRDGRHCRYSARAGLRTCGIHRHADLGGAP